MIIRSKAPLRVGFAGGGTDISPYCDTYGGYILNATINLYTHCTIETSDTNTIELYASDIHEHQTFDSAPELPLDGQLSLCKGVYNRIMKDYNPGSLSFKMTTYSDVPPGSGLGSSSTMVVCILKAFVEWLHLPLGEYELAQLAFEIERADLKFPGGKQDQYAAAFGGFNFMEFYHDRIIVNPLRIKRWIIDELEASMILFYTGASRVSDAIIAEQISNTSNNNCKTIEAMHKIKESTSEMKRFLISGNIKEFARSLGNAWEYKKKTAQSISTPEIDLLYKNVIQQGAYAGKVSGAGGGGFTFFIVDPAKKQDIINFLQTQPGSVVHFSFNEGGCHGWKLFD